ncbi:MULTISPECIES: nuclear transport factor 2 family protein [unclassified Paenibacillus]|uniref:nuclear transport factor 2 family protein n=1 Tax=unclassified Paenibacillus TaxID=185978 RepID=UPI001F36577D|nr:nuclear transport factor 2 family protein [Paenibacillus sp. MZ03-122A]MCF2717078.1 nuclear transport factor 2 family protein [Paenibacillus sp. UKAQ_18]MCP3779265.1 nuclear transport factor 2 family protein [Paenibacillus sp. MZ03-122A]
MTSGYFLEAQAIEILKGFQSSLVKQDFDQWFALFSEDAVVEFPYAPAGYTQRLVGIKEIRKYVYELFKQVRILSFSSPHLLVTNDKMVAEYTCDAVMTGTDKPYRQQYISIFHIKDGKITLFKDYWNPIVLLEAVQA